jgi:hypothetical protein
MCEIYIKANSKRIQSFLFKFIWVLVVRAHREYPSPRLIVVIARLSFAPDFMTAVLSQRTTFGRAARHLRAAAAAEAADAVWE